MGSACRIANTSKDEHRALNVVSTTLAGCFFPFPSFSFAFCSVEYQRANDTSNGMTREIHYRKVGNFLFLLFRTFWHGQGCGSRGLRSHTDHCAPPGPLPQPNKINSHMQTKIINGRGCLRKLRQLFENFMPQMKGGEHWHRVFFMYEQAAIE